MQKIYKNKIYKNLNADIKIIRYLLLLLLSYSKKKKIFKKPKNHLKKKSIS